ncbi:putative cyclin-dependent serine/threonine-protein kinase DDB_G0272797/DDB_G0274007 isoform X2 [Drosophila sechellia]|uniref:putative cyclin-dependent serine/threonine-protein kinase DDB_G0272797/DDB_G0274007 isoform X2 n=1 Tax=Drosophila sechellia TaxID=7238 RepID=UPI0013DDFE80|nr:putative cyclin-dependent serine/threonine-protein kinase DDB_G0272797/DDB_G0274007 isoform X2 [Drosophila sechellia]
MTENVSNKSQLIYDDLDEDETAAATQVNISSQLAKKIWGVTPKDISLGLVEAPEEAVPNFPSGCGSGTGCEMGSASNPAASDSARKPAAIDSASIYVTEVERVVYGDTIGYPENGTHNYFKAAENYSLFGESFLDFPKDTASCLAGLKPMVGFQQQQRQNPQHQQQHQQQQHHQHQQQKQQQQQHKQQQHQQQQPQRQLGTENQSRNSVKNFNEIPFPQFYHQMRHQAPPQPQLNTPRSHQHIHVPQKQQQVAPLQSPQQQQQQQYQQQLHRPSVGDLAALSNANPKEFALLYQQLIARNLRQTSQHNQQHSQQAAPQQNTNSAAAAAAMIYKNLEFQQQVQLRQLQQLHQQQTRMPRGIYGGNGGQQTAQNGKEPQVGTHK